MVWVGEVWEGGVSGVTVGGSQPGSGIEVANCLFYASFVASCIFSCFHVSLSNVVNVFLFFLFDLMRLHSSSTADH